MCGFSPMRPRVRACGAATPRFNPLRPLFPLFYEPSFFPSLLPSFLLISLYLPPFLSLFSFVIANVARVALPPRALSSRGNIFLLPGHSGSEFVCIFEGEESREWQVRWRPGRHPALKVYPSLTSAPSFQFSLFLPIRRRIWEV